MTFEYTGPGTSQRNHLVEVGFATIWERVKAMMYDANIPESQQYLLYQEAISHATRVDRLMITDIRGAKQTRFKHLLGGNPRFVNHMKHGESMSSQRCKRAENQIENERN